MASLFNSSLGVAALVVVALVIIYFMSPNSKKIGEKSKENHKEKTQISEETSVTKSDSNQLEKDAELVAVIMGALSAYLDVPASRLKIKSIKRSDGNSSNWRRVALRP